jgi:hypothetical protein
VIGSEGSKGAKQIKSESPQETEPAVTSESPEVTIGKADDATATDAIEPTIKSAATSSLVDDRLEKLGFEKMAISEERYRVGQSEAGHVDNENELKASGKSALLTEADTNEGVLSMPATAVNDNSQPVADEEATKEPTSYEYIEPPIESIDASLKKSTSLTLEDCLRSFTRTEQLLVESRNGFHCANCCSDSNDGASLVDAEKRMLLLECPETLVIHLKRLLPGGKFEAPVKFSAELDISDYLALKRPVQSADNPLDGTAISLPHQQLPKPQSARESDIVENTSINNLPTASASEHFCDKQGGDLNGSSSNSHGETSDKLESAAAAATLTTDPSDSADSTTNACHSISTKYSLNAVIVHQGGAFGGHYIAYVRSAADGEWYHTSDSSVRRCTINDVLKCQAYMLFYTRLPLMQQEQEEDGSVVENSKAALDEHIHGSKERIDVSDENDSKSSSDDAVESAVQNQCKIEGQNSEIPDNVDEERCNGSAL